MLYACQVPSTKKGASTTRIQAFALRAIFSSFSQRNNLMETKVPTMVVINSAADETRFCPSDSFRSMMPCIPENRCDAGRYCATICATFGMAASGKVAPLRNNIGIYITWIRMLLSATEFTTAATMSPMARMANAPSVTRANRENRCCGSSM